MATDPNLPEIIEWEAYEGLHGDRSIDWFWGVGLTGVVIGVIAILMQNILLAVLALVGTVAIILAALKHPELNYYALTTRGLIKDKTLYPWAELDVFWIIESDPSLLLIKSNKASVPIIRFPIPETAETQLIHDYMFQYIDDEPLRIGTAQMIMDRLGFY